MAAGKKVSSIFAELSARDSGFAAAMRAARMATKDLSRTLSGAKKGFMSYEKTMKSVGKQLSKYVSVPLGIAGAAAIKVAGDFEFAMGTVAAVVSDAASGTVNFDKLTEEAERLGKTTLFTAKEAADGMKFLGMAGFDTEQILGSMEDTLGLATAANIDLASAADIVSNIMTSQGIATEDLGRTVDTLVGAFTNANTDLLMLGESFRYAGGVANAFDQDLEDTTAILSKLADAGVQASIGGTTVRRALANLANPTSEAEAALAKLNTEIWNNDGTMRSLVDVLVDLEAAGATGVDMLTIFGDRAGPNLASLLKRGTKGLVEFRDGLQDMEGVTARTRAEIEGGFNQSLRFLQSALSGAAINLSQESGLLTGLTALSVKVKEAVEAFDALNPEVKIAIVTFGAFLGVAGPILVALGAIAAAMRSVAVATGLASAKLLAIVAIVAAVATAGVVLYRNWDNLKKKATEVFLSLAETVLSFATYVVDAFRQVVVAAAQFIPGMSGVATTIIMAQDKLESFQESIDQRRLDQMLDKPLDDWVGFGDVLAEGTNKIKGFVGIAEDGTAILEGMDEALDKVTEGLNETGDGADDAKDKISKLRAELEKPVPKAIIGDQNLRTFFNRRNEQQKTGNFEIAPLAKPDDAFTGVYEGISSLPEVIEPVVEGTNRITEGIQQATAASVFFAEVQGMANVAIADGLETIADKFGGLVGAALDGAEGMKEAFDALKQSVKGLIRDLIKAVAKAVALKFIMAGLNAFGLGGVASILGASAGFKIPGLATGGIVRRPTLAMVGERGPEAVVPLSKLSQVAGASSAPPTFVIESTSELSIDALIHRISVRMAETGASFPSR